MAPLDDLALLLASRHPLLLVETDEEQRFMTLLRRVAADAELPVWTWSAVSGLARDEHPPQYGTRLPETALDWIAALDAPGVFVLVDVHAYLENPAVLRAIKETAAAADPGQTLILTGPSLPLPAELKELAHVWALPPPDGDELATALARSIRNMDGIEVALRPSDFDAVVKALSGLSVAQAERIIMRVSADGRLSAEDLPLVRTAKAELFAADGILEVAAAPPDGLDALGGLARFKDWCEMRLGRDLHDVALDPPRGVLLTGVPGCGKSFAAKALAGELDVPLVLLDPARLYGRYIGESEQRLERTLRSLDAMAPAVVWIDEIEKGFATSGDGDGGVSRRLLGTLLRWMQERESDVFLVATANDVRSLPPEFLRRGRFDEIFFVDLPDEKARRHILRSQLERRGVDADAIAVERVARATDGFSGAELEAVVVGATYRATAARPTTQDLLDEADQTIPLSRSRAEEIAALRAWAHERAVTA